MNDICPICNLFIENSDDDVWKCTKNDKIWHEHAKCQVPRWNVKEDFKEIEEKPKKK